ncbi:hypothetical protein INT47_004418 [Mucor saturninus]|uniref:Uncharacterized protein n=1 Tax=Mucor saturninus TaxID=64648 RepID=A0A8H7UX34_9FUNG|nr:hypothetical protein INT47_004418 [Mucor saturninus]
MNPDQARNFQEQLDSMKAMINSLGTTVERMATVVDSLATAVNNNVASDQTVKGKRVAYVSDLGVSPQKNADNTFHIIKKFLIVYLGERFGADGVTWNALKVNEQDDIQYMLERIVFYWNQHTGEAVLFYGVIDNNSRWITTIPTQSGRFSLHPCTWLQKIGWSVVLCFKVTTRGMVCSLMGNARKNKTTSVENTMSMTDHMTMLRMNSSFSATSEQPVVPIALE